VKSFSQRKGLKATPEIIQIDGMTDELRNSLWNALDIALWSTKDFLYKQYGAPEIDAFARSLWFSYFKEPMDSIPDRSAKVLAQIRHHFFESKWFEVYDLLEFIVNHYERAKPRLPDLLNRVLERELAGYRFVGAKLTDITSPEELEMLEQALADTRFSGVSAHLQRALELYSDRENPDYRNSIKESISAVEAMARIIVDNQRATLADALKAIEKKGALHPALKDGFLKLYGYTSDEGGIRHAMLDEPVLTAADARYFLLSCTSFSNYLKSRLSA
jgi:AbiJ N-terminal domain 4